MASLRNEPPPRPTLRLDLAHHPELAAVGEGVRPASIYDELTRQQQEFFA